jgi:type I restriction enzyme M protein
MEIYDPTVGSGGMLIQSLQWVEEQGQNIRNLQLYGQESNPTTWIICRMNMILHNISSTSIEDGDTLEDPKLLDGNTWKRFDMVLANPPFSQNYSRAGLKFENRFAYGFAPESGKKADLMFVQHMVASLKPRGRMATIMPHGVLFRGGAEKVIRKGLVDANLIEAIISLPPALFYGTGIPACVIFINKNKPENSRDKILFINADAEYGEGKVQNYLRPEDIEKIDYVFTNKLEIPKYSRLVDKATIADAHDYNLNIRRYVDNTPEPEPEDVTAHLVGGVPNVEIESQQKQFAKFAFDAAEIFTARNEIYSDFKDLAEKSDIKTTAEGSEKVIEIFVKTESALDVWWETAREDFAGIADGAAKTSEVRRHLLATLKAVVLPLNVLDEFQTAGVFVNWWTNIKYDLKTIAASGWVPNLVPREYFIETYFQAEQTAINETENRIAEFEAALQETIEAVEYKTEEAEGDGDAEESEDAQEVTAKIIKDYLAAQIKNLLELESPDELRELRAILENVKRIEIGIKETKTKLKELLADLDEKIEFKMFGVDDKKVELQTLLKQNQKLLAKVTATPESEKVALRRNRTKLINDLTGDNRKIEAKLSGLDEFLVSIGGIITTEECKRLILQKHNRLVRLELGKYLNHEKRKMIGGVEKLWDKYAVSTERLESERAATLSKLNGFLTELNYLN